MAHCHVAVIPTASAAGLGAAPRRAAQEPAIGDDRRTLQGLFTPLIARHNRTEGTPKAANSTSPPPLGLVAKLEGELQAAAAARKNATKVSSPPPHAANVTAGAGGKPAKPAKKPSSPPPERPALWTNGTRSG